MSGGNDASGTQHKNQCDKENKNGTGRPRFLIRPLSKRCGGCRCFCAAL